MQLKYIIWQYLPEFIKKPIFGYLTKHPEWYGAVAIGNLLNKTIIIGKWTTFAIWDCGERQVFLIVNQWISKIEIGKYCSFAPWCKAIPFNHPITHPATSYDVLDCSAENLAPSKSITIGNDVWCGFNVIILSWVTIGDGAIIGAGSIVTKNVESYAIVAGNPAKFIRYRFPSENLRKQLLNLQWWNWDDEKIYRNQTFFTTDLQNMEEIPNSIVP